MEIYVSKLLMGQQNYTTACPLPFTRYRTAARSALTATSRIEGNVELAEGAHLYNSGDIYGDVTVKSGATLELNCNDPTHKLHGGTIHGNVTVYPG